MNFMEEVNEVKTQGNAETNQHTKVLRKRQPTQTSV